MTAFIAAALLLAQIVGGEFVHIDVGRIRTW